MICPNCGYEQAESFECQNCGIIFAKYEEHRVKLRQGQIPRVAWWRRPLRGTAKVGRFLVAVLVILLAVLLLLNGLAMKGFTPLLGAVLYLVIGIYLFFTSASRIPLWRFMVEGMVLGVVSGTVTLWMPEVFSLGHRRIYEPTIVNTPSGPAMRYVNAARQRIGVLRHFLEVDYLGSTEEAAAVYGSVNRDPLPGLYGALSKRDSELLFPVHARLMALKPVFKTLNETLPYKLPTGPGRWVPQAVKINALRQLQRAKSALVEAEAAIRKRDTTSHGMR